jgi:sugar lactone lactonase YvrE
MRKFNVTALLTAVLAMLLSQATASAQNLFVSDYGAGNIYQFTPSGVQSTFATGLSYPAGIAFDAAGNLFEADAGSGNIYKFTRAGVRSTYATGLFDPYGGLAFDSAGNLFAVATYAFPDYHMVHAILEINPTGSVGVFATGGLLGGLAFDNAGNLYATDSTGIDKFTPAGVRSTFADFGANGSPGDLAFDGAGNLFVSDSNQDVIYKLTPGGTASTFATVPWPGPGALAFDGGGNLFVSRSNIIYEYKPDGSRSTFATGLNELDCIAFQPTPEPATLVLLALGGMAILRRRRKA